MRVFPNPQAAFAGPSLGNAVVLGSVHGVAERIARQLAADGLTPEVPGLSDDRLPPLWDPQAVRKMKKLFEGYRGSYLHPGLSAWAERPELLAVGQQCGMNVISPSSRVLSLFGNKLNLFQKAEKIGIPNLVIDSEPMHSLREIEAFVRTRQQSFPFILKTAKGGSRFGIIVVHEAGEIESKLPLWIEQIRENCGEVILFAERYLEGSRYVSVPFVRLMNGKSRAFPMVDASLQCRQRKIVEFCPPPSLDVMLERKMTDWTLSLAEECGYVGVGALEFLLEGDRAYLIGGTARLNAAFHLWERVAGTHAVSWQLAALRGDSSLPLVTPHPKWKNGVALRFYAEDSLLQLPRPGVAREVSEAAHWEYPIGEAELDLTLRSGDEITSAQPGWLGTLWAGAQDRTQALKVVQGVLDQLWIAGSLQTNERFLSELLAHPWVREGLFHTGFVDEEFLPALRPEPELLRIFPSILESVGQAREGHRWAVGDQWVKPDPAAPNWVHTPERWSANGLEGISGFVRVSDGRSIRVCAYPLSEGKWQIRLGSWVMLTRRVAVKTKPKPRISSLIQGRVHSLLFREGATVQAHEPLAMIESLGMLVPHALPVDVRIEKWKVNPEQEVQAGQDLAEFEILAKP